MQLVCTSNTHLENGGLQYGRIMVRCQWKNASVLHLFSGIETSKTLSVVSLSLH